MKTTTTSTTTSTTTYNKTAIMHKAWELFRADNNTKTFGECLHLAWLNAKAQNSNKAKIQQAIVLAGIVEELHTWYEWKLMGLEVRHGSKALLQVVIDTPLKGEGKTFRASYFGLSQVCTPEENERLAHEMVEEAVA